MEQNSSQNVCTFDKSSYETKKRELRALENLNVIDNFLFQELLVDELNGEMADAEIRPNIYNIEPNNTYERKTLPKRMRYYHGLRSI